MRRLFMAIVAAGSIVPAAADAAIVTYKYTSIFDATSLGLSNAEVGSLLISFDAAQTPIAVSGSPPTFAKYVLSAMTFTIGGQTTAMPVSGPNDGFAVYNDASGPGDAWSIRAYLSSTNTLFGKTIDVVNFNLSDPTGTAISSVALPGGGDYSGLFSNNNADVYFTDGTYARTSSSTRYFFQNATAGVPEPATWAMLMLGFGAIGAGLRRGVRVKAGVATA